jgi:hypothetical protein
MFATSDRNKGRWSSLDKLALTPEQLVAAWKELYKIKYAVGA